MPSSSEWPRIAGTGSGICCSSRATLANGSVAKSIGPACSASDDRRAVGRDDRGSTGGPTRRRSAARRARFAAAEAAVAQVAIDPFARARRRSSFVWLIRSSHDRSRFDRGRARSSRAAARSDRVRWCDRAGRHADAVGDDALVERRSPSPTSTSSHRIERVTRAVARSGRARRCVPASGSAANATRRAPVVGHRADVPERARRRRTPRTDAGRVGDQPIVDAADRADVGRPAGAASNAGRSTTWTPMK